MSVLLALFLVVHASIHIGYICGPVWPFEAVDPWPVTTLGVSAATISGLGSSLIVVSFVAFLLAALAAIRLLPSRLWRPLIVLAAGASAVVLVIFATPWTLPGLAVDVVLLWATLARGWEPRRRPDTPRAMTA